MLTATEDAAVLQTLPDYDAVVFLLTTRDVLDRPAELALQRFIQAGGGFVGIHSASDTEFDWPWYGRLVGAYFTGHPPGTQEAVITVVDTTFAATAHLPQTWMHTDEWYDLRTTNQFVNVVLTVDEFSYKTPEQRPVLREKPIAWYHEFDGGRAFYTALGHTVESYSDPLFRTHLREAVTWAAGEPGSLDYARETVRPEPQRFEHTILADTLHEPMELAALPDGRVVFVERPGQVHLVDPAAGTDLVVAEIPVYTGHENGLIGMAASPDFAESGHLFLFHSPPNQSANRVSRFTLSGDGLADPVTIIDIPHQREQCCHSGGSLAFGPDGLLFLSTGDDTNPFESDGYAPTDERPGRQNFDAQRTSANSDDLRGKILRIRPLPEGGYEVPEGNLFPADGSRGRPEIYAMGLRNPFRINVDQRTGYLYWGDLGPDAPEPDSTRGPAGHDEINQARTPGFFGWPYFVADNKPYAAYDFADGVAGEFAVGAAPANESPNSTGRTFLPPAQGAWLWYPYSRTDLFPLLGEGGRSAMAGPVYYADQSTPPGLPTYYNGRLFMHEWMRNRVYTVAIDEYGWYGHMEVFLEDTELSRPMDLAFGPDGRLFMLEYGQQWGSENPDARLRMITFR